MENFGLELEMSKSRLIEFGRYAEENRKCRGEGKPETFTFLGLTHYCSHSKSGNFRVKRKTSKKNKVRCSLFYWLNRRSQKISYTWKAFNDMLKVCPLAKPRIYVSIYGT